VVSSDENHVVVDLTTKYEQPMDDNVIMMKLMNCLKMAENTQHSK